MNGEETQQNKQRNNELEGWTKEEKFDLLQGLKAVGSHDIESMQEYVPDKTPEQIKAAIAYYKDKALIQPTSKRKIRNDVNYKSSIPLFNWAKLLTDNFSYEELQTEIATALRLIAEFEDIPSSVCTENVDFRKAYHLLANAVEGKALFDDKFLALVLNKCVLETALSTRTFIRNSALKHLMDSINITDSEVKTFVRPSPTTESVVSHLALQKNYNPLNIPVQYLKPAES